MSKPVHIARYITLSEANLIHDVDARMIMRAEIDDYEYDVSIVRYAIKPYTLPVTPKSYLSCTRGVGSNIAGFLDVDKFVHHQRIPGSMSAKTAIIETDVTENRTSFLMTVDNQFLNDDKKVTHGYLQGGSEYYTESFNNVTVPIPVPVGLMRTELGILMESANSSISQTNPFEINFISSAEVYHNMLLFRPVNEERGNKIGRVKHAIEFIKKHKLVDLL